MTQWLGGMVVLVGGISAYLRELCPKATVSLSHRRTARLGGRISSLTVVLHSLGEVGFGVGQRDGDRDR